MSRVIGWAMGFAGVVVLSSAFTTWQTVAIVAFIMPPLFLIAKALEKIEERLP